MIELVYTWQIALSSLFQIEGDFSKSLALKHLAQLSKQLSFASWIITSPLQKGTERVYRLKRKFNSYIISDLL